MQRAVASGLRHWVVLKQRENALTLLDLRYPPRYVQQICWKSSGNMIFCNCASFLPRPGSKVAVPI